GDTLHRGGRQPSRDQAGQPHQREPEHDHHSQTKPAIRSAGVFPPISESFWESDLLLRTHVIRDCADLLRSSPLRFATLNTQVPSMARTLAALALLTLGFALTTSVAHAQTPNVSVPVVSSNVIPLSNYTYWPSYSYWTAAYYGYPPRIYIGLGNSANDFPYY